MARSCQTTVNTRWARVALGCIAIALAGPSPVRGSGIHANEFGTLQMSSAGRPTGVVERR